MQSCSILQSLLQVLQDESWLLVISAAVLAVLQSPSSFMPLSIPDIATWVVMSQFGDLLKDALWLLAAVAAGSAESRNILRPGKFSQLCYSAERTSLKDRFLPAGSASVVCPASCLGLLLRLPSWSNISQNAYNCTRSRGTWR